MIVKPYLSPQVNMTWMKIQVTPLPQEVNMTRVRRSSSTKEKVNLIRHMAGRPSTVEKCIRENF
jgi:hypothetical protein